MKSSIFRIGIIAILLIMISQIAIAGGSSAGVYDTNVRDKVLVTGKPDQLLMSFTVQPWEQFPGDLTLEKLDVTCFPSKGLTKLKLVQGEQVIDETNFSSSNEIQTAGFGPNDFTIQNNNATEFELLATVSPYVDDQILGCVVEDLQFYNLESETTYDAGYQDIDFDGINTLVYIENPMMEVKEDKFRLFEKNTSTQNLGLNTENNLLGYFEVYSSDIKEIQLKDLFIYCENASIIENARIEVSSKEMENKVIEALALHTDAYATSRPEHSVNKRMIFRDLDAMLPTINRVEINLYGDTYDYFSYPEDRTTECSILDIMAIDPQELPFTDVDEEDPNYLAINYLKDREDIVGYPDGTYKPENPINRAEFTKILVEAKIGEKPTEYTEGCFNDFDEEQWFTSYVCYAKDQNIINGYPDGTFKPANNINLAEASKILVNMFALEKTQPTGAEWYSEYIETLEALHYIPDTFEYVSDEVTRGQMAEMVWRIMEDKQNLPYASGLTNSPCQELGEDLPANIDMDTVRETWLSWYNEERRLLGLHEYIYDDQLNRTATQWSKVSRDRGYMDHKRDGSTDYYDFYGIMDWFAGLGIEFVNSAYTENIAWEMYYCDVTAEDCTQDMINSVRKGFDFFMSEKGGSYTAHYDSIISPNYNIIGLGVAINDDANKFYLTVHYAKGISNEPMRICE
ncbi:S-layer homology domain-containing protein [Patescibacteria group bacterium]